MYNAIKNKKTDRQQINPGLDQLRPVLIPHHKGRKRMHYELRDTMARVGADIELRLLDDYDDEYMCHEIQEILVHSILDSFPSCWDERIVQSLVRALIRLGADVTLPNFVCG